MILEKTVAEFAVPGTTPVDEGKVYFPGRVTRDVRYMNMNDNSKYTLLGNFDLKDAKDICDLIEKQSIDFELEIDDTPIRNMSPFQAAYGGNRNKMIACRVSLKYHFDYEN